MKRIEGEAVRNRQVVKLAVFRYEIVNLTSYGGDTGFPIATDVVLSDLRIKHNYVDGRSLEIPLYDGDGVRQVDLDSASLYLRSDDVVLGGRGERIELSVTGKVQPTRLNVSTSCGRAEVRVLPSFALESIVLPGLYDVLCATDYKGNKYPIGTIAMIAPDSPVMSNAFVDLRKASSRHTHGLKRRSVQTVPR